MIQNAEFINTIHTHDLIKIKDYLNLSEKKAKGSALKIINEATTPDGFHAMHLACINDDPQLIKFLMGCGANLNSKANINGTQTTALQLSIKMRRVNCAIELMPFSDLSTLSVDELRDLILLLIEKKDQHSLIQQVSKRAHPDINKKLLHDWKIFSYAVEKEDIEFAYSMLLRQTEIHNYARICCFLSQCIEKKDIVKIQKIIPHLAEKATNKYELSEQLAHHYLAKTTQSLFYQSLEKDIPEFLEFALDHLPSYLRYLNENHIKTLLQKNQKIYVELAYKILEKHENKWEIIRRLRVNNQTIIKELLAPTIIHDHKKLFSLLVSHSDPLEFFAFLAAQYSVDILSGMVQKHAEGKSKLMKFLFPDGTKAALRPNAGGEKLIYVAARSNKACYDYLLDFYEGQEIPLFEGPIKENDNAKRDTYTQVEISDEPSNDDLGPRSNKETNKSSYIAPDSPVQASQHTSTNNPAYYSPENEF